MATINYITACDAMDGWRDDVLTGKTAFVMQGVVDALRLNESLRAVVCNIEMPAEVLLDRQLSRLSGVPLNFIRYRQWNEHHADRIDAGLATIESFADELLRGLSPSGHDHNQLDCQKRLKFASTDLVGAAQLRSPGIPGFCVGGSPVKPL